MTPTKDPHPMNVWIAFGYAFSGFLGIGSICLTLFG